QLELRRSIDLRYAGQSFELSLPIASPIDSLGLAALDERFGAEHARTYGHRADGDAVEVVHVRVEGRILANGRHAPGQRVEKPAATGPSTRQAFFGPRGLLETVVISRGDVGHTARKGPLIVEEYDATTVVPPGWSIHRDSRDNLLIEP